MSPAATKPRRQSAVTRAKRLLTRDAELRDGYLDAICGDAPGANPAQRTMRANWLPVIYERVWRPFGFWVWGAGRTTADEERLMHELLAPQPGDRALDLACGPGNTTRRLTGALGEKGLAVGVDAAGPMIARAVEDTTDPNVAYVRADAADLPFADGTFDCVSCFGALYLVDDAEAVLAEMTRVLAPGGRIAILTSVHRGHLPLRFVLDLSTHATGIRVFDRDEVTGALERDGLTDIRQEIRGFAQFIGATRPGKRRRR